jgi:hypothetical protein
MTAPTIRPLRKRKLDGVLYQHDAKITARITELLLLPDDQLIERCASQLHELPDYVPTECLVYLVRTSHGRHPHVAEQLFRLLADRILRRLPPRTSSGRSGVSLTGSNITDEVFGRIVQWLSEDRQAHVEQLDYLEIRFNDEFINLVRDARKKVWRREGRTDPLGTDEETGELLPAMEKAIGLAEAFDAKKLERLEYRSRLGPAINTLPAVQRRIVEMNRQGIPFFSENPKTVTISKVLGMSDKTARTYFQHALITLNAILNGEKSP